MSTKLASSVRTTTQAGSNDMRGGMVSTRVGENLRGRASRAREDRAPSDPSGPSRMPQAASPRGPSAGSHGANRVHAVRAPHGVERGAQGDHDRRGTGEERPGAGAAQREVEAGEDAQGDDEHGRQAEADERPEHAGHARD